LLEVVADDPGGPRPPCEWIESGLREIPGQDPLGLQTITTDRILPALLPGVLALSRRARYLSIYAFLVRRYGETASSADNQGLDRFIRHREFELGVAINMCPRCDADGAIGNRVVRPLVATNPAKYDRQLSIRTELGGYGLYYRSPMEELEVVAPAGHAIVGDRPNPVDVLRKTERAAAVADAFEAAIAHTAWYREWMHGIDAVPAAVFEELAQVACLCRLNDYHSERDAIRRLLLTAEAPERAEPTEQRRRAFALLLEAVAKNPDAATDDGAFREEVLREFAAAEGGTGRAAARAQWAAVVMRECLQDAVSTLWVLFCRAGLRAQPFDGLSREQLAALLNTTLFGVGTASVGGTLVRAVSDQPSSEWLAAVRVAAQPLTWEELRQTAAATTEAATALAVIVELAQRTLAVSTTDSAWDGVAGVDGDNQPGLLRTAQTIERLLDDDPPVPELLARVTDRFIVRVHETVAMSKLPVSTFRFFWEHGRLRFVDNGVWRFTPSGLRRDALATISHDLGWWSFDDATPTVTAAGTQVIEEIFGQ
jgi:hypothetical protein